jgi:diketogulonate reductase-like aldo/keto reductase
MRKKMEFRLVAIVLLLLGSLHFANAQVKTAGVPYVKLNNGLEMPRFGLGTFTASNAACKDACLVALKSGYRHIDTAHAYGNEDGVGTAVKESGIPREEIWITSKLWPSEYGEGITLEAIDKMLARLQTKYIDLLYVHQPVGDFVGAWKDMEKAVKAGKVRALGISNFDDSDEVFSAIVDHMEIKPVALQIECHPYAQRKNMQEKVKPYNILIECWYPLGHGDKGLLSDPVIGKIAEAHKKTIVQIILRWHIQEGFSVIPGATNPDYIQENINIFDFALSNEEMAVMRSLNKEKRFFNMTLEQKQGFVNMKMND